MADELPDDMQDLLNELDAVDGVTTELEAPGTPIAEAAKAPPPAANDDLLDELEDVRPPDGTVMRPVDERHVNDLSMVAAAPVVAAAVPAVVIDIDKYKQQLDSVTKLVLDGCQSDRAESQDVINMLRDYITSSGPSKALVDGLVQAIEVKANINQNAIRMIEANTKFIAAAKSQIKVEQNLNIDGAELSSILDGDAGAADDV